MTRLITLVLCSILLSSLPVSAHHTLTAYNRNQQKTVAGVVKEFRFANPHTRIVLLVAGENGTMKEWDFEGGSPRRLGNRGFDPKTIAKGDKVTVSYNPMRDGSIGGFFVGLITADGKYYGQQPR
jgi:hypothetical protein